MKKAVNKREVEETSPSSLHNTLTFEASAQQPIDQTYPRVNLRGWNETNEYLDALHLVQDFRRRMDDLVRQALLNGYRINVSGNIVIDRMNHRNGH